MFFMRILFALAIVGFIAGPLAACAGTRTTESTGEYVDDSVLSNKLLGDKDLNMFKIDVTTFKGEVQLSGFVDNAAAKARATQVAQSIEGVKMVHNNLVVKQ
jgi:osmotically-inducible protein OsmY